jgi:hypothetical protein
MLRAERPELFIKQYIVFGNGGWAQIPVLCVFEEKPHGGLNCDCLDRFEVPLTFPGSHTINRGIPGSQVHRPLHCLAGQGTSNVNRTSATSPRTRPVRTGLEMATEQSQHKNTNGTYWERSILFISLSSLYLMKNRWWRRRESNPRPKLLSKKNLRAYPVRRGFAAQHQEPARVLNR